ncbi:hypothetical protein M407DRAFT_228191 [Tulasnella calospora MUT 4182]|uniref:Uncharacterized protein n=1 Tax=Tulasnella calospora MUT 4182 TaxID=1051891 RepID=A0A0C3QMQ8_9AGAM|nr:hypothetical protein M407DRAFT_228191 [Tulasnella calospora MUT 4182]
MSKLTIVWPDAFRWFTKGSKDWRALLPDSPTSRPNEHLESLVTRMVRFEVNWNKGQPREIRYFTQPPGFASRLIPGVDIFVLYWSQGSDDFDSNSTDDITRRVLINYHRKGQEIWAMDVAVDPLAASLEFDLALELASQGKSIC